MKHLRALRREFEHFLVGDHIQLVSLGNDARIAGEDAVHVCEDVAAFGIERAGERDGADIRSAAPQSRDAAVLRGPLESPS